METSCHLFFGLWHHVQGTSLRIRGVQRSDVVRITTATCWGRPVIRVMSGPDRDLMGTAAGGPLAQSSRTTPKARNFFAYASLRFSALAAVSTAAWMALGPLGATVLIKPNLCAASACARLKVAIRSAWTRDGFICAPLYKTPLSTHTSGGLEDGIQAHAHGLRAA